jgi:DNA replication protein DnaC
MNLQRNSGPIQLEYGSINKNIEAYCKLLSLSSIALNYEAMAMEATKTKISYQEYLHKLLQQQVIDRVDRSINSKIKKAGFPYIATLEEFDFSFQPKLDEKLLRELSTLNFLSSAHNIAFIGPPGVGKTHLAIAIGLEATKQRRRVLFISAEELTTQLVAAKQSNTLVDYLDKISKIELLIIDEIGYLDIQKDSASLFFQLISKRYEKSSIIITSNKPFQEWGDIFKDDVVASAILDRLLHHSYPFLIQGKSYRMRNLTKENSNSKQTLKKEENSDNNFSENL